MKYKVGDKVRIINNKKGYTHRKEYVGQTVTVKRANPNGERAYDEPHYSVKERIPVVFFESELEPVNNQKIVITSDGVETLARLYYGNKVVKTATAKCSPDDTFDFKTGAMLAFERLMNDEKKPEKPFKFEIGKQYQYADAVIEIVKAKRYPHDITYHFKTVKGDAGIHMFFDENSYFAQKVKPYDPPKYYNGKVVCVKSDKDFTVGKVYEFIDGKTKDDHGHERPCAYRVEKSLDEWKNKSLGLYDFIPLVE